MLFVLEGLLRCLGSQTRDTNVLRHDLLLSSRRYIQKHKQYTEKNLMQYALSYRDAFRPCSRVSTGDNNTIYTSLTQNIHIVRLSKIQLENYYCIRICSVYVQFYGEKHSDST